MVRVLLLEENADLAEFLSQCLRRRGYSAVRAESGARALHLYSRCDLVLIDLELPDIDGLEICRTIRTESDVPIISFTGRDTELDRVLALQAGADDCVAKSCGFRELLARIEAVLRRVAPQPFAPEVISRYPLHIDCRTREVRVDGRKIDVTAKEFELLCMLAANPETVVTRKTLMTKIWHNHWTEASRTIDTHVSSLRSKLGARSWIITVRGVGYRMGAAGQWRPGVR